MKRSKKEALKRAGWRVGDAQELLSLSDEERLLIEVKHKLMSLVRATRQSEEITQGMLAEKMSSSQSRIAKIESGSADVSLDLILRALLSMGVSVKKIGNVIAEV